MPALPPEAGQIVLGNHLLAVLLIGSADAILEANGTRRDPREEVDRAALVCGLQDALNATTFADTYGRGRRLSAEAMLGLDGLSGTGAAG